MAKKENRYDRAWLLQQLRLAGRLPDFVSDSLICELLQVRSIEPRHLRPKQLRLLHRPVGPCPKCHCTSELGCLECFAHRPWPFMFPREQVAQIVLGRGRVYPKWLWDATIARAFGVSRDIVRRLNLASTSLCAHCGRPGRSLCLKCLISPPTNCV